MKVALLQQDIIWADRAANIERCSGLIAGLFKREKADLIVLPEMFTTGFCTEPEGIAEDVCENSPSLEWMRRTAQEYDCAVAGSIALQEEGKYFNRFYFVTPESTCGGGRIYRYDKKHLFSYGGENKFFTAGSRRTVAHWKGMNFLLQTCYDLRFPVFSRNSMVQAASCGKATSGTQNSCPAQAAAQVSARASAQVSAHAEYDAIIYVASWPEARMSAWQKLLPARAIENQAYVIGVNRVGKDATSYYSGGSVIVDAKGNTLLQCNSAGKEEIITAELDMVSLNEFRKKFPVLMDAD